MLMLKDGREVVRKEFKAPTSSSDSAEAEHRSLALLNYLKHPNIVELLNVYTFRHQHNFLFPLASQGDLTKLLCSEQRPADLESEESIYIALSGLASALEKTHNFSSRMLNLELIGCHHDFRPSNILVDGNRFILADFGLSRLKSQEETSKTLFRVGMGHYLAPECEGEDGISESTISRPSDIWSFGCILTEILTLITYGAEGVALYKDKRRVKERYFTTCHFHSKARDSVQAWLLALEPRLSLTGKEVLSLAQGMMALQPADRPVAKEVTYRLRHATLKIMYTSIKQHFDVLSSDRSSLEATVEYGRFIAWGWALQEMQNGRYEDTLVSDHNFDLVRTTLLRMREEVNSVSSRLSYARSRLFFQLQLLNDELMRFLPSKLEKFVVTQLESWMINTDDADYLRRMRGAFHNSSPYHRIGLLAAMKHVALLFDKHKELSRPDLDLKNTVRCESHHNSYSLGKLQSPNEEVETRVLIEWKEYGTHYVGAVGDELVVRVEALAELLHSAKDSSRFRALHCAGYFHDLLRHSFGLVHNFPAEVDSDSEPLTLAQVLFEGKNIRTRPVLNDRFKLAYQLCVALFDFHKVGWLHKNLTAQSIIFFRNPQCRSRSVHNPYVIGFNHSRPDEASAFSEGPNQDSAVFDYQHPEYRSSRRRFRPEYDYYSLGLVLLEIGIWMPLDEMISKLKSFDSSRHNPQKLQQALHQAVIKERVSVLGQYMGTTYRDAVRSCLEGQIRDDIDSGGVSLFAGSSFARLVIQPLRACCV